MRQTTDKVSRMRLVVTRDKNKRSSIPTFLAVALLAVSAADAAPYNLIGWYTRSGGPGVLLSYVFKAGAAQGCPNYGGPPPVSYVQPCYDPAHLWTINNSVVTIVSGASPAGWDWDGITLTESGLFWATLYSFPTLSPGRTIISFRVEDVSITPGAPGTTVFGSYSCYEDFDPGNCAGAQTFFNLWNVVRDDGTYLILSSAPAIGTCFMYGTGSAPACPTSTALMGRAYMVFAAPDAPDLDGDGTPDGLDNCTGVSNEQYDANGDGYGNICDADLNNTGLVTTSDYTILRNVLNTANASADLNHSGSVTVTDYTILRNALNAHPGPSGLHPNCPPTCP